MNNRGMALVMVLIVLVATTIIGVFGMRTATLETKITGNERAYKQSFYAAEGAGEFFITQFDNIMTQNAINLNQTLDLSDSLPGGLPISVAGLTITLSTTGMPPIGSGTSVSQTQTNYYRISTSIDNHNVVVGVWKSFPTN